MARIPGGGRTSDGRRALTLATVQQLEQIRKHAAGRIATLETQLDRVRAQQREAEEQLRGMEAIDHRTKVNNGQPDDPC